MKLLMISGDRSILQRKQGAFWYTLQELRKHFDQIDVITPQIIIPRLKGESKSKAGESALIGGSVFFHPCPNRLLRQPRWIVKKGKELIKAFGHDVMTVHEYPPFYNGIGAKKLAKKMNIPYALEVHHIVGYPKAVTTSERIGKMTSKSYFPRAAKSATAIRVVNKEVGGKLLTWGVPKSKINLVPSFYLDGDILTTDHAPPVIYDVVFCGRLVPNKGLENLILAVSKLSNVRLAVIGSGPELLNHEKLVSKLGLDNLVTFLGWLPTQETVVGALLSSRIFVMPSQSEGGPRSLLEAMAVEMPVITTPVGVAPEIIEDGVNGIMTNGEPDDMAEKIKSLLADEKLRKKMGKEAGKIMDIYERKALVKMYADFLKGLA
ncbi:MAG: glycosyltransferase [Candidatus Peribacteraceae bacterium]|jgi:glycosyltransferase involved in cell wall biosynthesis|nr:hypothetical protein [Parcubacteria group bacterium]MDP6575319.1 glycosyltransferase [Candidatus Peribacteraceae bacterium]|tara:strand:+ start:2228 stop:3358 length:1131 start_codon:yes stop_codon:yes gene_type:complete